MTGAPPNPSLANNPRLDRWLSVEADGRTVLDNTLILYTNELSNGRAHSFMDLPYIIAGGATALPEGTVLPLTPGNMGLVTLAMSAVTVAWVVYALRNDDRPHAYFALGLTLVFGVAFIVVVLFFRGGVVEAWQRIWRFSRQRA